MHRLRVVAGLVVIVAMPFGFACDRESGGDVGLPATTAAAFGEGPVSLKGIAFDPKEVHVKVGEELVWNWDDGGLSHTVTADDGSFDSGRKGSGSFSRTFTAAGTIAYHCEVHAAMKGTIVVTG